MAPPAGAAAAPGSAAPAATAAAAPAGAADDGLPRLPCRIVLLRHGESEGNVDETMYSRVPDPEIALTPKGHEQAAAAGRAIRAACDADCRVFCYFSPYLRSRQTAVGVLAAFDDAHIMGVREEPQLREQDFANFQDGSMAVRKAERRAYGRFFYRFPDGESGADVYDRITVFEDHLVRDMDAGRFGRSDVVIVVTHGLTLRVFLARWFHWTVLDFERTSNPDNCAPVALERRDELSEEEQARTRASSARRHTKALYVLDAAAAAAMRARGDSGACLQVMLDPRADALGCLRAGVDATLRRRASVAEAEAAATRHAGRSQDVTRLPS